MSNPTIGRRSAPADHGAPGYRCQPVGETGPDHRRMFQAERVAARVAFEGLRGAEGWVK